MPQFVLINKVWTRWLSDAMTDMNTRIGANEGTVLLSNQSIPVALKFADTNLCVDMSIVSTDAELAAQKTVNAADSMEPIIDSRTQTVYVYDGSTWNAQPAGSVKSFINVGQYYWNATNNAVFFAFALDRVDRIGDFGPATATQTQVNAGTADNVAVTAAQAKIAWQLWKTQ